MLLLHTGASRVRQCAQVSLFGHTLFQNTDREVNSHGKRVSNPHRKIKDESVRIRLHHLHMLSRFCGNLCTYCRILIFVTVMGSETINYARIRFRQKGCTCLSNVTVCCRSCRLLSCCRAEYTVAGFSLHICFNELEMYDLAPLCFQLRQHTTWQNVLLSYMQ